MEGEREGEKHQWVVASGAPPTGDLAHNPGMCPNWESNWWPFGRTRSAQSTDLHQPGLTKYCVFFDGDAKVQKCNILQIWKVLDITKTFMLPYK